MADTSPHHERNMPKALSGQRGSQARSTLPHGTVNHPDIRELLRNSAMHFGGNDATVAHLLDVNTRNLISGDPRMHSKHGIALYEPLNHFTEHDAPRLAHGLLGARRHASPQARDLYSSAIHNLGYRFDEHGHIHKVHGADFDSALRNSAFRAHIAVENDRAAHLPNSRHDGLGDGATRVVARNIGGNLDFTRSGSGGPSGSLRDVGAVPRF